METLAERIARDGPVNELDAIGWAIRLAKRLEALHQLGVAHGSVSPACILTSGQDRNARAYLADVQHTTPSPAYHSPERILGGDISTADDVWALGATLYALLTGQSPFAGANDAEIRQKILAATPAPLAVFDVGDDDLQHILDRAFARELPGRTSNVAALRRALEEWHPDRGVANLPPLEDEDSTNDDEDVARTVMVRDASAYMQQKLQMQVPKQGGDDDDEDDDNVRTVMRSLPGNDLAAMIAKATAPQAPASAPQPGTPYAPPGAGPPGYGPAPNRPGPPSAPRPGLPSAPFGGRPLPAAAPPPHSPYGQPPPAQVSAPSPYGQPPPAQVSAPSPYGQPPPAQVSAPSPYGQPSPAQVSAPSPYGQPPPAQVSAPSPYGQPPPAQVSAPSPYGQPPPAQMPPPRAPFGSSGGGPAPASAPIPGAPAAVPRVGGDDDDDDDDNARTVMRSSEQILAQLGDKGPPPPPPSFGGARPGFAPPEGGFPAPQAAAPAVRAAEATPQPASAPKPWAASGAGGPSPAPTMALPMSAFEPPADDEGPGGGTNPMNMPGFPGGAPDTRDAPERMVGGGTQPMGSPAMAAIAALAQQQSALMGAPGANMGASAVMGSPGASGVMGAPGANMGASAVMGSPGASGVMGAPGANMGASAVMGAPGAAPGPAFGGLAAPGDLSVLEGPTGGAVPGLGLPQAPDPSALARPPQAKSGKGLLVVAAVVALLIAAAVTFLVLRSRAG